MEWKGFTIETTVRKNCKRLILRALPGEKGLRLTIPPGATRGAVEDFLTANEKWIAERMRDAQTWEPAYAVGERHRLLGAWVTLGQGGVPTGRHAYEHWRAAQLAEAVRPMIAELEERLGVRCAGVRLREMTSRWGSCQPATGMVTLNTRLACVPARCVRYVVAHELCHLLHANHSAAFYAELVRAIPDWQERKRELNGFDARPKPADGQGDA